MIAEDSSDKPLISAPVYAGEWALIINGIWLDERYLRYMELEVGEREHHHHLITFSLWYAFTENFVLPLSHDECFMVKSRFWKDAGDYWRKFANLRLLYAFMMTHPGKNCCLWSEWGQYAEWKIWSRWIGNSLTSICIEKWTNMSSAKSFLSSESPLYGSWIMILLGLRGLMRIIINKVSFHSCAVCGNRRSIGCRL